MLPEAHIQHSAEQRVRLRIPSKKGDAAFFSEARKKLSKLQPPDTIEVNPLTGSILLCREAVDIDRVSAFAEENDLFSVIQRGRSATPLAQKIADPFVAVSRFIDRLSGGELDLATVLFLSMLGVGFYEILKGNFRRPPWYTAFWYAFGFLSKSILDRPQSGSGESPAPS